MAGNDFKALIFKELGDIRMEMTENARATKLRTTDDTESTNYGTSSLLSHRSSTSDAENQSILRRRSQSNLLRPERSWRRRWRWPQKVCGRAELASGTSQPSASIMKQTRCSPPASKR